MFYDILCLAWSNNHIKGRALSGSQEVHKPVGGYADVTRQSWHFEPDE